MLLPGHGTRPADLIGVRLEDWQRVVREQVALLKTDVDAVYLGGFSTGANLVLEHAIDDTEVRGLLLFSPAIKSDVPLDWLIPTIARTTTWLRSPDGDNPQQSPLRYLNLPSNGFAQFYRSSVAVRESLARRSFDRPALIVAAQHDSVVDTDYVRRSFAQRFTHPASRMIWYGDAAASADAARVLTRSDRLPAQRISQFSHMGLLFSPLNPLYGVEGSQRICWNGQSDRGLQRCAAGAEVEEAVGLWVGPAPG